jgi:succinate dehydrogenase/fumarate reductase iron-sulfur protein
MSGPNRYRVDIRRYKPGSIDPARMQTFAVERVDGRPHTVLDALELIRNTQDGSLMYRHSCHHSACGTCACTINGKPQLACITPLSAFEDGHVVLEPLQGFPCIGDLTVDMTAFFRRLDPEWSCRKAERLDPSPESGAEPAAWLRFEDCIECGCCVSACPETRGQSPFVGPAVLTALHRQYEKVPAQRPELLVFAGGEAGVQWCRRALACSRVCPTRVYPARHIFQLQQIVEGKPG